MSNIVSFSSANLPSPTSLVSALANITSDVGPAGVVILKMDRVGHWVFGADQDEVEDDSVWAVNPFSFVHGFIAWGDGEVLGEKMTSVSQPLPELPEAPPGAKKGWEMQIGCSLKCMNGQDEGLEARYTTTSVGGKKAVQALAVAIANQVSKDPNTPVPVVALKKEHYQHKSFGRIYTPLFDIQKWVPMDGGKDAEPTASEDTVSVSVSDAAPAEAAPTRRRRST